MRRPNSNLQSIQAFIGAFQYYSPYSIKIGLSDSSLGFSRPIGPRSPLNEVAFAVNRIITGEVLDDSKRNVQLKISAFPFLLSCASE